jgi:hypothetical protein
MLAQQHSRSPCVKNMLLPLAIGILSVALCVSLAYILALHGQLSVVNSEPEDQVVSTTEQNGLQVKIIHVNHLNHKLVFRCIITITDPMTAAICQHPELETICCQHTGEWESSDGVILQLSTNDIRRGVVLYNGPVSVRATNRPLVGYFVSVLHHANYIRLNEPW